MVKGCVFKYGDNVDTDVILPGAYLSIADPKELATHCLETLDKDFATKVRKDDIIVGGENFGCGSSREHAPVSIKACGVSCVIAKSFARIFYRNAINIGLAIIECPEAVDATNSGDELQIDFKTGLITNLTTSEVFQGQAFPDFIQRIIDANGLINSVVANK